MDAKTKNILTKLGKEKVELGRIENILKKADAITPFDVLLRLNKVAQTTEKELYKVMQEIEELQKEASRLRKLAQDLGANDAVKTLDTAENVLKTKFRRTREAIKIAQSGSRLLT